MPFVVLIVGTILLVAAWRNAHGQLGTALGQDVPGFLKWALALSAVAALGWIPKMAPVSRALLALVLIVLLIRNYQALFAGFTGLAQSAPAASSVASTPAAALTADASATGTSPTTAQVQGTGSSSGGSSSGTMVSMLSDPSTFLHAYETSIGFGGTA